MLQKISLAVICLWILMPGWCLADIYGIKNQGAPEGAVGSVPPTHFFSFKEDGTGFTDYGPLKLNANDVNLDALAYSPAYGFRAYDLRNDAQYNVTGSHLVSIDPNTLTVTPLTEFQDNRHILGAVFVGNDLWVLDVTLTMALKVDPNTGAVLAGQTLSPPISDCCDLAVARNGTVYLINYVYAESVTKIYTLDLASGTLTLVHTQAGENNTYVGAAFSLNGPASKLFAFDVSWATTNDDIFVHNIPGFDRTLPYPDIIPGLNAGRGDLASEMRNCPNVAVFLELLLDQ